MKTDEEKKKLKQIANKLYREKNKEKIRLINLEYRKKTNYDAKYYEKNSELIKNKRKNFYIRNKEKICLRQKNYTQNNILKIQTYYKNKELTSPIFKLKKNIRSLIRNSFYYRNFNKKSKTVEILGCSYEEFKIYLESKFESWMSWENRGWYNGEHNYGWDIDHIIPLDTAITEEDVIRLNHYTNLQPLCSYINRVIKKNNI